MKSHRTVVAGVLAAVLLVVPRLAAADPAAMVGTWIDHTGRGAIEIGPCNQGMCGRIVWMQQPNDTATGKPLVDGYNPDASKRARPICGLQVIGDAKPQRDGTLDHGWIYNPEDGASYSVELKLVSPNVLRVHGYAGLKFLGESFVWKRAPQSLGRCAT